MTAPDLSERSSEDEAALARLETRADAMLARTIAWAKTNTGSWNAGGLKEFAPVLQAALGELEAEVTAHPSRPIETVGVDGALGAFETGPVLEAIARPEAPAQIVLTGHYDTVFPPGTFETVADLGEGRLGGPGVADMKGGVVVMLEALKTFETGPLKDRLGYRLVLTPDEETGNFASAEFLRAAAADRAQIGLTYEPAMENGAMSGGRKGSAIFDIVFHGKASHAGRAPEAGRSAINAAAAFVGEIEALTGARPGVTFNVGRIDGGGAVNVVPDLAIVRMGSRAPDAEAAAWATAEVNAAFERARGRDGISGELRGGFYRPPKPRNAAQSALFEAAARTGRALGLSLEFADTGGVCEGNNVFAAGVPNIDTLGVRGGAIHSDREFVIVESFVERAGLSAMLLNRIADGRIDAAAIKALMKDAKEGEAS